MNDTHLVRHNPGQGPSPFEGLSPSLPADQISIDAQGPGMKRDYAGLLEYWQIVRRHKGAVIIATCLGAVCGFALTLSSPRVYQARTTMEIQGLNQEFLNMKN